MQLVIDFITFFMKLVIWSQKFVNELLWFSYIYK